jgi:hypothetical protein
VRSRRRAHLDARERALAIPAEKPRDRFAERECRLVPGALAERFCECERVIEPAALEALPSEENEFSRRRRGERRADFL